jgi:hypothetical protein
MLLRDLVTIVEASTEVAAVRTYEGTEGVGPKTGSKIAVANGSSDTNAVIGGAAGAGAAIEVDVGGATPTCVGSGTMRSGTPDDEASRGTMRCRARTIRS